MTAEEFLKEFNEKEGNLDKLYYDKYIEKFAKEFTKYHVEQALKAASEQAYIDSSHVQGGCMDSEDYTINKESILNAYPFENIK